MNRIYLFLLLLLLLLLPFFFLFFLLLLPLFLSSSQLPDDADRYLPEEVPLAVVKPPVQAVNPPTNYGEFQLTAVGEKEKEDEEDEEEEEEEGLPTIRPSSSV